MSLSDPSPRMPAAALQSTLPWWVLPGLAALVLLIYAGSITASCLVGDTTLRTTMLGSVVQVVMLAVGYFFGSSAGSAKKDEALASSSAALATSAPIAAITTAVADAKAGAVTITPAPAA